MTRAEADSMRQRLEAVWSVSMHMPVGDLEEDLQAMKTWFDPVAQGQRLRAALSELEPMPHDYQDPGEPWTLDVGDGRLLITPEGRCALALLSETAGVGDPYFGDWQLAAYDRRLASLYRNWARHRLDSVVKMLKGEGRPIQYDAAGAVLALLVNGAIGEDRALVRAASGPAGDALDRMLDDAAKAFAGHMPGGRKSLAATGATTKKAPQRLIGGWRLYEIRRQLGVNGVRLVDGGSDQPNRIWIETEAVEPLIERIVRDLFRGHRTAPSRDQVEAGFDDLASVVRDRLPILAAHGVSNERPAEARRVRQLLLAKLDARSSER